MGIRELAAGIMERNCFNFSMNPHVRLLVGRPIGR